MKVLYLMPTTLVKLLLMKTLEYLTGQGGMMILGLIVITVFVFRKYKERRYFKDVEKRMSDKQKK